MFSSCLRLHYGTLPTIFYFNDTDPHLLCRCRSRRSPIMWIRAEPDPPHWCQPHLSLNLSTAGVGEVQVGGGEWALSISWYWRQHFTSVHCHGCSRCETTGFYLPEWRECQRCRSDSLFFKIVVWWKDLYFLFSQKILLQTLGTGVNI